MYLDTVDAACLVAFQGMAGVSSRERIAASVRDAPRWEDLELDVKGTLTPSKDVAMITYQASAKRGSGVSYSALVSSGYVKRDGRWKLVFHQQTPLKEAN